MEIQLSEDRVLVNLGLTPKQAKVYLALAKFGPLRVAEISKNSQVARPDVYQTLDKLQQMGLVEKIIETPLRYKAISLENGLSLLLEARTQQYARVKAETEVLRVAVKAEKHVELDQAGSAQFVLVPEGKPAVERIGKAIINAQQTIDIVVSWKRIMQGLLDVFVDSLEVAWAKNVKVRCIVEKPQKNKTSEHLIEYFRDKPSNQMRFIPCQPDTVFGIYDKKEISIAVIPKTELERSPALFSSNEALINLAGDHFEVLWRSVTEGVQ